MKDNGPGIGQDIIDCIFDPYFTTKEVGKRSGMGLSVVHGLVKNHNGTIKVDSQVGRGTSFIILLPVIGQDVQLDPVSPDEISGGGETVLFVDDDASIADMIENILKKLGYHAVRDYIR